MMNVSSYQPLRFRKFARFFISLLRQGNNSIHLDVSGDHGLHLLLNNYRRFVIKTYNNIKLNGPGIRLVNDGIQLKLCMWRPWSALTSQ